MNRIKHDNINDWLLWPSGKALHLGDPANTQAQRHKIYVNALGDALVYAVLDSATRYPLVAGPGVHEIEFAIGGGVEIQVDSENEVFLYSFGVERTWYDTTENPSWARPHEGHARDEEMEIVAAMTARNMMTLFSKQAEATEKRHAAELKAAAAEVKKRTAPKNGEPKGDPKQPETPAGDAPKPVGEGAAGGSPNPDDA